MTTTGLPLIGPQDIAGVPATSKHSGYMTRAYAAKLDTLAAPVRRLTYTPGTDLLTGAAMTANTWLDVAANQNFTVGTATASLLVIVRMKALVTAAAVAGLGVQALFNSAGTPVPVFLGGGVVATAGGFGYLLGADIWLPAGTLPAGSNTVKVQIVCLANATANCRPLTVPLSEYFHITVEEFGA